MTPTGGLLQFLPGMKINPDAGDVDRCPPGPSPSPYRYLRRNSTGRTPVQVVSFAAAPPNGASPTDRSTLSLPFG